MSALDPFGTSGLRDAVLAGWAASVARFREDANSEQDHALGGYRDRLVVELAQNAADAATRAGVPGQLLLRREATGDGPVLIAANTGAPLDAAGVQALATLRASAKRDDAHVVGRFGVGFAAVLAVADEVSIASATGAVRFSRNETERAVAGLIAGSAPGLADELAQRQGQVPVLRLPFPATAEVPPGYDTAVTLRLRDDAAVRLVDDLLAAVDDTLLLALPGLDRIIVERPGHPPRELSEVDRRWHVVRQSHELTDEDLRDRPAEERTRRSVSLTWAAPKEPGVVLPGVIFAPTPTDEPLTLPAILLATLPLEPSRRHVAPGRATDAVLGLAARAYADLSDQISAADPDRIWSLVPSGLPVGVIDAVLREQVVHVLRRRARLPLADGSGEIRVTHAVVLADLDETAGARPVATALSRWVAGLVVVPRPFRAVSAVLGLSAQSLADLIHQLPSGGEPEQWLELYAALAAVTDRERMTEALATVPVPLADGRVVRGPQQAVLLDPTTPAPIAQALVRLGVRVVASAAAHPVLERGGAQRVSASAAIDLPGVRDWVDRHRDDDSDVDLLADPVDSAMDGATAVLTLLAAGSSVERGWLGELLLRDEDGEPCPARDLVLPGSIAAELIDDLPQVDPELLATWGAQVLTQVGVLASLRTVRFDAAATGALVASGEQGDASGELEASAELVEDWARQEFSSIGVDRDAVEVAEIEVVADLEVISDHSWPSALRYLAGDPDTRRAVLTPVSARVVSAGQPQIVTLPSPTAWWLRRELFPESGWADPHATPLIQALLPAVPELAAELDAQFAACLGAVRTVADLGPAQLSELLETAASQVSDVATLVSLWRDVTSIIRASSEQASDIPIPQSVPAIDPISKAVVAAAAESVLVVDAPYWLQRTELGALVPVPPGAAALVGEVLDLASVVDEPEIVTTEPASPSEVETIPTVRTLLPSAPAMWRSPDVLAVDGDAVDWWVRGNGPNAEVWALTLVGAAEALAWASGHWSARAAVLALLTGEDDEGAVAAQAFS